jgi:hypothetical protein
MGNTWSSLAPTLRLPQVAMLAACVASGACARSSPRAETTDAAVVAPGDAPSTSPDARAPAASAPRKASDALGAVGMPDGTLPPREAIADNDAAVALLARKDTDGAVAKLRSALERAPGFVLARYNLACALSRAGDLAAAARELEAVFDADWVGLRAQAERDEDLAPLRATEAGKRLLVADVPVREARYRRALERGVRAITWSATQADAVVPEGLRVGVWDARGGRFVAMSERRRGAIAAIVSRELPFAVVVIGSVPTSLAGDLADHVRVEEVAAFRFGTSGGAIGASKIDKGAFSGSIRATGDEEIVVDLRRGVAFDNDPKSDRVSARVTWSAKTGTKTVLAKELPKTEADVAKARAELVLPSHNGFETWTAAPGWSWDAKASTLAGPDGKRVVLPKTVAFTATRPSIATSADGARVALVWDTHVCDACGERKVTVGAHRIVLVDVPAATGRVIAEGTGVGAARFADSGALFVQRDRRAFEVVMPADPATWNALPEGVLLVAPVVPEKDVRCCGF